MCIRDSVGTGQARLAGDAGDEAGEAGARTVGQAEHVDGRLHGARGDVDDSAEAARRHAVHRRLDQLDGGQHIGVQRRDPLLAAPVAKVARRGAAGVVNEDVDPRADGQRGGAALGCRDVAGHGSHLDVRVQRPQRRGRREQVGLAPRRDDDIDALTHQGFGATAPEALARRADQSPAALQSQIHVSSPATTRGLDRPASSRAPGCCAGLSA